MNLLAIETATEACSVALLIDDEQLIDHRVAPREHARLLLPMIDALLAEGGLERCALDGVVFGRGPGSFTGVRVAASVAQGIALGLDIGVIGVSTLAAIAQGCHREHGDDRVGVALDARLDEVYWGAFELAEFEPADNRAGALDSRVRGLMLPLGEERVCSPDAVTIDPPWQARSGDAAAPDEHACLAGAGAERYRESLTTRLGINPGHVRENRLPHAADLLTLALPAARRDEFDTPEMAIPVYLRDRVALTEAERAAVRGG